MLHQIGNGALGPVFRAYDQDRDRLVAVKLFRLDLPPEKVHQLVAEFEKLIEIELQHPLIAAPRATGIDGNSAYLAQDFAAAESLDIVMRENGPAPPAQAVRVAGQLAEALDYAADRAVVHGALHPRDILLSQEDIRIVGLGIARALERVGITAPVRRPYAAPERINDGGWDRSADIFSLAAIVYEMLCGKRVAGTGSEAAEAMTEVPGADMEALQRVFALALAADPSYRYATASAFTDALKDAMGIETAPPRQRARRKPKLRVVTLPLDEVPEASEVPGVPEVPEVPAEVPEVQEEPPAAEIPAPGPDPQHDEEPPSPEPRDALAASEVEPEPAIVAKKPRRRRAPAPTPVAIESVAESVPEPEPFIEAIEEPVIQLEAPADYPVLTLQPEPEPAFTSIEPEPEPAPEPEPVVEPEPEPVVLASLQQPAPSPEFFSAPEPSAVSPEPSALSFQPHAKASVWPIGVAAVIGIAIGFGVGYTMAIRDRAAVPASTSVATTQPAGKEFTEVAAPEPKSVAEPPVIPTPVEHAPAAKVTPRPESKAAAAAFVGRLLVRSTPSGARVFVDGKDRGQTPATIRELGQGEHRIRLERNGYASAERKVTLSPKQASQSVSVPLKKSAAPAAAGVGSLVVESRPAGASVIIDGRHVGTTPLQLSDVAAGSHAVRLERDGYRMWTGGVSVSAGEQNRVTASLEK